VDNLAGCPPTSLLSPRLAFKKETKTMKKQAAVLVSLVLITKATLAAPPGEGLLGVGVGAAGCGEYLQNRRTPNRAFDQVVVEWAYGYISGYNRYSPKPQIKVNVEGPTILAYLDKYCREAPLASTSAGVSELIGTLAKP
jgi:hypothetical protein